MASDQCAPIHQNDCAHQSYQAQQRYRTYQSYRAQQHQNVINLGEMSLLLSMIGHHIHGAHG